MGERFAQVARRVESGALDDALHLQPEQRNIARVFAVSDGREQSEETHLADRFALLVVALDADVVEIAASMYGRPGIRLVEDQPVLGLTETAHLRRKLDQAAAALVFFEKPEPGTLDRLQIHLVLAAVKAVLAVAEEGEVFVDHPRQQRLALRANGRIGAGWPILQRRAGFLHLRLHLAPVADRDPNVVEDALDFMFQHVELVRIGFLVDDEPNEGFAPSIVIIDVQRLANHAVAIPLQADDRVNRHLDIHVLAVDGRRNRIHEKWHVVVHQLNNGVGRIVAVLFLGWVEDANEGLPWFLPRAEFEVRHRGLTHDLR